MSTKKNKKWKKPPKQLPPKVKNYRIVEVLIDGEYIKKEMKDLKKGDKFKLYEHDGTPIRDQDFNYEFEAKCDAFISPFGVYGIDIV